MMININLIPPALRGGGKGVSSALAINIPREVLLGVAMGLIFLFAVIHMVLGMMWVSGLGRLADCKTKWQYLSSDKTALDAINSESKDLRNKFTLIAGMTTQKSVAWSPKFNAISDALSKGLWLKRIVLDKDGLVMEGSVVSKSQSEVANVDLFLSALKQNDNFMKDFSSLEVNSIQRDKNNAVEVTDFTVMAKLKQ